MADTLNTLKTRRSCRAYTSEHVEEEKLNAIIEAGTYAATGMPCFFVLKVMSDISSPMSGTSSS